MRSSWVVSITWAHHSLIEGNRNHILQALFITIALGIYFTLLQASEYYEAPFTISDGVYGSTFFVATGFHGLHVIIGSTFLIVCFFRQLKLHFTSSHHFGFEAAACVSTRSDQVWEARQLRARSGLSASVIKEVWTGAGVLSALHTQLPLLSLMLWCVGSCSVALSGNGGL